MQRLSAFSIMIKIASSMLSRWTSVKMQVSSFYTQCFIQQVQFFTFVAILMCSFAPKTFGFYFKVFVFIKLLFLSFFFNVRLPSCSCLKGKSLAAKIIMRDQVLLSARQTCVAATQSVTSVINPLLCVTYLFGEMFKGHSNDRFLCNSSYRFEISTSPQFYSWNERHLH